MRLPILMLSTLFVLSFCVDLIIYKDIKRNCSNKYWRWTYIATTIATWALLIIAIALPRRDANADIQPVMWMLYTYMSIFIPKTIYAIFSIIALPPFNNKIAKSLRVAGAIMAICTCFTIWWGALVGAEKIHVTHQQISIPRLPNEFDGLKLVHISDIHCGTWGNDTAFLSNVVDSINTLTPDIVLFTGDIVNRHSAELLPFADILSRINAKHGVFSVLGNHDYGDYMDWDNPKLKLQDIQNLKDLQTKMGWTMLNNSHHWIYSDNDSIAIIGVENWGEPPFSVHGDLSKAYPNLMDNNCKILLSHNPEHWTREVVHSSNIDLTLSGHTHAMQFILKIGNWKWSPSVLKYDYWGGLYSKSNDLKQNLQLYVNIGLGSVALPFRIGAYPEITLITLKQ